MDENEKAIFRQICDLVIRLWSYVSANEARPQYQESDARFIHIFDIVNSGGEPPTQLHLDNKMLVNGQTQNNAEYQNKESAKVQNKVNYDKGFTLMPNARERADGRLEWRQTINKQAYSAISRTPEDLERKVRAIKKSIKKSIGKQQKNETPKKRTNENLYVLCLRYYENNIKGKIASHRNYLTVIDTAVKKLKLPHAEYSKDMIFDVLNKMKSQKQARICFYLLRKVLAEEYDKGNVERNVLANAKAPSAKSEKGVWYNIEEQQLIYKNRFLSGIGDEIEFFLLTGCRRGEAFNCVPDFDNAKILVIRTKRDGTTGYVGISKKYCEYLKTKWDKMFKKHPDYYADELVALLDKLGIKRQENEKPIHRLRHSFATNIYYLGAKDAKQRAYLLGHRSSKITDDIYTDFDPYVKKEDVEKIYGNLYPEYN